MDTLDHLVLKESTIRKIYTLDEKELIKQFSMLTTSKITKVSDLIKIFDELNIDSSHSLSTIIYF